MLKSNINELDYSLQDHLGNTVFHSSIKTILFLKKTYPNVESFSRIRMAKSKKIFYKLLQDVKTIDIYTKDYLGNTPLATLVDKGDELNMIGQIYRKIGSG